MTAHILKVVSIAFLAIAPAPRNSPAPDPITVTLAVPLQMKDLPSNVIRVRVHCLAHPGYINVKDVDIDRDYTDSGPVVGHALSGTVTVVLHLQPAEAVPAGQQWHHECHAEFVGGNLDALGNPLMGTTSVDSWAALAPTSGPNLVSGSFTSQ